MASTVDICNLALAHLGDEATVSAISPSDGSAQADLCARFYPIALNSLLEMHPWAFATKREVLGLLSGQDVSEWLYCYSAPTDMVNPLAVLDSEATNDYSASFVDQNEYPAMNGLPLGIYTPQTFVIEAATDGTSVIRTNLENATLRYTGLITDTTKFSPLFTNALAWLLASHLAGPLLKGDAGRKATADSYRMFMDAFARANSSDASQRRANVAPNTPWMTKRA